MTDREIDDLIAEIDGLARRLGCRFVPDPDKIMAFRCAKSAERAVAEHYQSELRKLAETPDPQR